MPRIALASAIAATGHDDDQAPLLAACAHAGLDAQVLAWDDPTVSWRRYDAVLLRSTWNYTTRLPQFMAWCERVDRVTTLLNPLPVLRWNTDKHYLADLAAAGVPIVPSVFVETDEEPLTALRDFLALHLDSEEFVVKPAVGAGSRDAQRYARDQEFAAANHIGRLLDGGRSVLLQPYLASVDRDGETALIYFDGDFSHAIRKGPLLRADSDAADALFAREAITARVPVADERSVAGHVLAALAKTLGLATPLAYARIDLIRDSRGEPRLLELELCEPSLFFVHGADSASCFVDVVKRHVAAGPYAT
ncbi:MAG: hypothetical protein LH470_00385 [Lysobacter sp.]|nr:hypothetical protein [Lysobacter sp.]